jgi:hypothetical protein
VKKGLYKIKSMAFNILPILILFLEAKAFYLARGVA